MACDGASQCANGGNHQSTVDVDRALRLLSDPLCRHVLRELASRPSNWISHDDLVTSYVGSHPDDEDIYRESVEIQCHHSHFPALAQAGLIEYDSRSKRVRYRPGPFVEEVMELVERYEP